MDGGTTCNVNFSCDPAPYPGSETDPIDLLRHAESYRSGAMMLLKPGGDRCLRAPGRLCAIQGIELYLNAYLLHRGESSASIRSIQHDMARRVQLARKHGIVLRAKTTEHLNTLSRNREYVAVRYAPEMEMRLSPLNRLTATLNQVAGAVRKALAP
jgi:hypothetical protein